MGQVRNVLGGIGLSQQESSGSDKSRGAHQFGSHVLAPGDASLLPAEGPERLLQVVVRSGQQGVVIAGEEAITERSEEPLEVRLPRSLPRGIPQQEGQCLLPLLDFGPHLGRA